MFDVFLESIYIHPSAIISFDILMFNSQLSFFLTLYPIVEHPLIPHYMAIDDICEHPLKALMLCPKVS